MRHFLLILIAQGLFAQSFNSVKIIPKQNNSATGTVDFQELYSNGQNYVGWKAPANIPSSFRLTLPSALPTTTGACLGISTSGVLTGQSCESPGGGAIVTEYNWSQSIGTVAAGTRTLTFTPCPLTAADTTWAIRVFDGSSSEVTFPTGTGTCTAGAATGTVQVILANSYTSGTAESASDGIQEAINSVSGSGGVLHVKIPVGSYNVYSDVVTGNRFIDAVCDGPGTFINAQADNVNVFNSNGDGGIRLRGCALNNPNAKVNTTGLLTYNATGSVTGVCLIDNSFANFAYSVRLETVNAVSCFSYNRFSGSTNTDLFLSQISSGDAGIGLIGPGNIFLASPTTTYGINWWGPGNLKIQDNSFNGYIEQVHLEPHFGVAAIIGTAVTRISGPKFRSSFIGGGAFVGGSTVAAQVIAVAVDGESLTLDANAVTCNPCSYYVGNTSQLLIQGNTFDSGTSTTHSVRAVGDVPFYSTQIQDNYTSNPNSGGTYKGISIEGHGFYFGEIQGNNLASSYVPLATGINMADGLYWLVSDNNITNHLTGVNVGAAATGVTVVNNYCTQPLNTTNCILSAAATTLAREVNPVTFTQLSALTVANGSTMYCSDCRPSATSLTCTSGGGGSWATRVNSAWGCQNINTPGGRFVFGGNSFGAHAILGTNDNFGIVLKANNANVWSMQTDGSWWAVNDGTPTIGTDGASRPGAAYVTGVVKSGTVATNSNCSDSAGDAACGSASAGRVVVDAADTTTVVSTTAVTAASEIHLQFDASLGAALGVTCNTTYIAPQVTARSAGVSFTITLASGPVTNPECISFRIVN
jgi:hypothetical protein